MAGIGVGGNNSSCGGLIAVSTRFRSASAASRAVSRARRSCTSRTRSLSSLRHSGREFRDTPGNSISVDFRSRGEVGESPVAFIAIGRILSGRTLSGQRENAATLGVVHIESELLVLGGQGATDF